MNIILATTNNHKRKEFSRILKDHTLFLPSDFALPFDFEETAETFTENSLGKARALAQIVPKGYAVLADDSGLCVDALKGQPGVRTARYGMEVFGHLLEEHERNEYLLKNMKDFTQIEDRSASFVCALSLIVKSHRVFTICESVEGHITFEQYGKGGFGYDPVFFVTEAGKTMAELTGPEKDLYSHRGRATRHLITLLGEL
ncbi:RdgB/HAM1 family non-canonical purine NTP pyrophosphatase [uncultured Sphaerochaeta sp.]|uniref:RdgB/HAM1 family non-canonical purine NTP pyrophosphatase n=1 Tax=uncultured Sphaerochaeta sp. TaxID=886478 RepID=UPI002A0A784D|nr:RdgB/HAM1 family non-canonical purine NTP pyrophosphatase [uncultured Sphaerochaeta sp.]